MIACDARCGRRRTPRFPTRIAPRFCCSTSDGDARQWRWKNPRGGAPTARFSPRHELRRFEDVIFTHGGRNAYTGGTHLVLRLSAVWKIERELGRAVVAAIVSPRRAAVDAAGFGGR